jgi:hypothetical protein
MNKKVNMARRATKAGRALAKEGMKAKKLTNKRRQ